MKNIEFAVLETTDRGSFETTAQTYLRDGWDLHGSLIALPNAIGKEAVQSVRYIQAFIRKKVIGETKVEESGDELIPN